MEIDYAAEIELERQMRVIGERNAPVFRADDRLYKSLVRVIRSCGSYGRPHCTPLAEPVILMAHFYDEPNQWGDTVWVRARYAAEDFWTEQGGRLDENDRWIWRCYAD